MVIRKIITLCNYFICQSCANQVFFDRILPSGYISKNRSDNFSLLEIKKYNPCEIQFIILKNPTRKLSAKVTQKTGNLPNGYIFEIEKNKQKIVPLCKNQVGYKNWHTYIQ